jgi:hypothetical protein
MTREFWKFLCSRSARGFFPYPFGGTPNICTRGRVRSPFPREGAAVIRVATTRSRDALPDLQKRISWALSAERGEAFLGL